MSTFHTRTAVVAALFLAAAAAGCSSSGSHSASGGATTTTSTPAGGSRATTPTTHGSTSIAPTTTSTSVLVPAYNPARNTRKEVVPGACTDGGAKGWSFQGTVTNSATTSRGYSITVDFITVPGDTVRATRVITVPRVAPHATANWSVDGAVPGEQHLTCVVRQSLAT